MKFSYLLFLIVFLVLPTTILAYSVKLNKVQRYGIVAMVAITAVAGISWDEWMAANGIWEYDPKQIIGIWLGYIPVEEIGFILLIPVLVGLWVVCLYRFVKIQDRLSRWISIGLLGVVTIAAILGKTVASPVQTPSTVYLIRLLSWTTPIILGQILLGWQELITSWKIWWLGSLVPVVFFHVADAIALRGGVWMITPSMMLNYYLPGRVPIEEDLFFLTTSLMITQGMVLFSSEVLRQRFISFFYKVTSIENP